MGEINGERGSDEERERDGIIKIDKKKLRDTVGGNSRDTV
jgi:hypothetical protein